MLKPSLTTFLKHSLYYSHGVLESKNESL